MKLEPVTTRRAKKHFIRFIYTIYTGNPNYKDMQVHLAKNFLYNEDTFTRQCTIHPVRVQEAGKTVAQCMYIRHPGLNALQLSFFEALPGRMQAVTMLVDEARERARQAGLAKVIIGLNGHVSYGVGFLMNNYDKPISFDNLYSPPYYIDYFDAFDFTKKTLHTYYFDMNHITISQKLISRINQTISFRTMNFKKFNEEITLFGTLCNQCLKDTYLYFNRTPVAMCELLTNLKPFLKPEYLIFALKDGREIGFMFWHPDYNRIMPGGKKNSIVKIALRYFCLKRTITHFKLNVIGILPGYANTATLIGLVHKTYEYAHKYYRHGETNFVWDNNVRSRRINEHMTDHPFNKYCIYEVDRP